MKSAEPCLCVCNVTKLVNPQEIVYFLQSCLYHYQSSDLGYSDLFSDMWARPMLLQQIFCFIVLSLYITRYLNWCGHICNAFYSASARRRMSYSKSVRPSVTRWYCIKMTQTISRSYCVTVRSAKKWSSWWNGAVITDICGLKLNEICHHQMRFMGSSTSKIRLLPPPKNSTPALGPSGLALLPFGLQA